MIANRRPTRFAWLTATVLSLLPCLAYAQTDPAAAQALFEEAKTLMKEGRYEEACPKLAASQRLDPGGGTLLNLAVCYEEAGKPASAWEKFKEGLGDARRRGRKDRERFALEGIARVEPKLSRLTIVVSPDATREGLEITRGGVAISEAAWGVAIPLDPGTHQIRAQAPGHEPWQTEIQIGAEADQQSVTVPALVALPPEAPVAAPQPGATSTPPATPTAPDQGADGSAQRTAGWIIAGIGGAATVVGVVFGVLAISDESTADEICGDGAATCPTQDGVDASEAANRNATVANVLIFPGLAVAAAGVIIALTAPDDAETAEQATRVVPWAGPDGGGLTMRLRW